MSRALSLVLLAAVVSLTRGACTGNLIPTRRQEALAAQHLRELFQDSLFLRWGVRMGFHDCWQSGCDGYIDLSDGENAGLEPMVKALALLYEEHGAEYCMSLADLYALSFSTAVEVAAKRNASPHRPAIDRVYGRKDVAAGSKPDTSARALPDGQKGLSETQRIADALNVSLTHAVALVGGGHAIGGASPEASGFKGSWTTQPDRFDNEYFQNVRDREVNRTDGDERKEGAWSQIRLSNGKFQWGDRVTSTSTYESTPEAAEQAQKRAGFFLLNVDMALYVGVDVVEDERDALFGLSRGPCGPRGNATNGPLAPPQGRSGFDDCFEAEHSAEARAAVDTYASQYPRFVQDFSFAANRLIRLGSEGLTLVRARR